MHRLAIADLGLSVDSEGFQSHIRTRTSRHGILHSFLPTKPLAHSKPVPPLTCDTEGAFRRIPSTAALAIVSAVLFTADTIIDAVSNILSRTGLVSFDGKLENGSDESRGSNHAVWKSNSETTRIASSREQ